VDSCGVNSELTCEKMGSYTRCGSKMGMGGVSSAFECKKKGRTYTLQDENEGKAVDSISTTGKDAHAAS